MTGNRTTTSTTWGGWQAISPYCYGCIYGVFMRNGVLVCHCASRTMVHSVYGDRCASYFGRDAR